MFDCIVSQSQRDTKTKLTFLFYSCTIEIKNQKLSIFCPENRFYEKFHVMLKAANRYNRFRNQYEDGKTGQTWEKAAG